MPFINMCSNFVYLLSFSSYERIFYGTSMVIVLKFLESQGFSVSFVKLKRIKCCPLPYNLPSGSSANLTARHEVPSFSLSFGK